MNIIEAVKAMQAGKIVQRKSRQGYRLIDELCMVKVERMDKYYTNSLEVEDILAEDWEINE